MFSAIRVHTGVHLKFLRRNRVLHGFAAIIALGTAILMVPSLLFTTAASRFNMLRDIAFPLHIIVAFVTAGLGLFIVWSHRKARSIKMVATKPTPFIAWVCSVFAAVALVAAAAHAVVALIVFTLSVYWHVPYQLGFVYLAATCFVDSLIGLATFTTLSALMHPVLAVVLIVFLSEWTTIGLWGISDASFRGGQPNLILRGIGVAARGLYYVMPTFWPLADRTTTVMNTMRVAVSDWRHLGSAGGYAVLVCAFGVVTTLVILRRRQLT